MKRILAEKGAKLYTINASKIAMEIGMGRRTNTILQSAFFYLNQQILPYDKANSLMKEFAKKSYTKKGADIVELNYKAIDAASANLVEVEVKPE
jgi:pyruvate-ferredoxin/flavodoxin oxidoreductase